MARTKSSTTKTIPSHKSKRKQKSGPNDRRINIFPQKATTLSKTNTQFQCWAHTRNGTRCKSIVPVRESEKIPIPYCNLHLKSGDGALKVVHHPFAGKCLVARYDLPAKYRMVFHGKRGRCGSCDKEDRAISFYPPNKDTGKNKDKDGNLVAKYNGVGFLFYSILSSTLYLCLDKN